MSMFDDVHREAMHDYYDDPPERDADEPLSDREIKRQDQEARANAMYPPYRAPVDGDDVPF